MRLENVNDPRHLLCRTKFFGLHPKPLQEYIYSLRLSRTAERVFWFHWNAGLMRGDWCSEVAIEEVARQCFCDKSGVSRAYNTLQRRGLIRRINPGRDPHRPYNEAVRITEVLLPEAAQQAMHRAPNRTGKRCAEESATQPTTPAVTPPEAAQNTDTPDLAHYWSQYTEQLRHSIPEPEFNTWIRPLQAYAQGATLLLFSPNRFAVDWLQRNLLEQIRTHLSSISPHFRCELRVGCRPTPGEPPKPAPLPPTAVLQRPTAPTSRKLTVFKLAELRRRLTDLGLRDALDQRFRETVWSIEVGHLAHIETTKAINTAVMLIRNGRWSRPKRMPQNWARCLDAVREHRSAA